MCIFTRPFVTFTLVWFAHLPHFMVPPMVLDVFPNEADVHWWGLSCFASDPKFSSALTALHDLFIFFYALTLSGTPSPVPFSLRFLFFLSVFSVVELFRLFWRAMTGSVIGMTNCCVFVGFCGIGSCVCLSGIWVSMIFFWFTTVICVGSCLSLFSYFLCFLIFCCRHFPALLCFLCHVFFLFWWYFWRVCVFFCYVRRVFWCSYGFPEVV